MIDSIKVSSNGSYAEFISFGKRLFFLSIVILHFMYFYPYLKYLNLVRVI